MQRALWLLPLALWLTTSTALADPPQPEAPRTETQAAEARLEASLRAAAQQRDEQLQLGPSGPLLTALRDAVHAGAMKVEGETVLEARVDAKGTLVSLDVLRTDSRPAAVARTMQDARERLAVHPVRLPSFAKGATFRVRIASRLRLPSGRSAPRTPAAKVISTLIAIGTFEWGDLGSDPKHTVAVQLEQALVR